MNLEIYRIAKQNLRANRTRTMLTTLGIVIGVMSITLVLALGESVRQTIGRQVSDLGGNVIVIKPGLNESKSLAAYNPYRTAVSTSLTERDLNTAKKTKGVADVAPIMILGGSIKVDKQSSDDTPIIASSATLLKVLDLNVKSGQFIDEVTNRDTVVLGQQLAIDLFGTDEARGQSVLVKGRQHTVIGVVRNTNTPVNLSGVDLDRAAYVSFDDGKSYTQGIAQIQQLVVRATQPNVVDETAALLEKGILANHDNERDFSVLSGEAIANSSGDFFTQLVRLTFIVSAVTLLVSGIGVMNILLVGVTERTREIGIRKALGATNRHILGQFLTESLIICLSGGIIGIILAYVLALLISIQLSLLPVISPLAIGIGFGSSLVVGVLFGLYPAMRAAKKDPIEALRQYQ